MSSPPSKQQLFPSNSTAPEPSSEPVCGKRKSQSSDVHKSAPEGVDSSDRMMSTEEALDWLRDAVPPEMNAFAESRTLQESLNDFIWGRVRMEYVHRRLNRRLVEQMKEVEKWKSEAAKLKSEYDELKAACHKEKEDSRATFKKQTNEFKSAGQKETEDLRATFKRQTDELKAANKKEKEDLSVAFKRQTDELKAANLKENEDLRAVFKRQTDELKAANQKENEDLGASFKRQTKVMHKLRGSLSIEQSHVGILLEKIKKLEAKKEEVIDEYRTSEEFGNEVFYYAHLYADSAQSVGYAEALKDAKEKYPSLELSEFPLFNPNAQEESQLKILVDEVGWRAAPVADNAEASGSKPAVDNH